MDGSTLQTPHYKIELQLLAHKCREEIVKEYEKYNKKKKRELYLQTLTEIKEAIEINELKNLKTFCKLTAIISDVTHKETLKSYYRNGKNPLQTTNLIILVCKHNNVNALEYIFDDQSQILDNLSVDIGVSSAQPCDKDEECHNSFYYAIRSNNVDLIDMLVKKWPNHYFDTRLDELEEILSKTYDEIRLKNISLSEEMEFFVENKLIDLRFFSDGPKDTEYVKPSLDNVKERMGLVRGIIDALETEYSGEKGVDEKFLFSTRFIAQNIHILKRYLKPTYAVFPWEEIEFSLITFTTSMRTHREINLIFNSILTKKRILNHLTNFSKRLTDIGIKEADVGKTLPNVNRDKLVKQISDSYPAFEQLYNDYKQVVDIYSLDKISAYIELALKANPRQEEGRLVITRALQVIGEHLKNSLESPKLSNVTGELLLSLAPINTSKILRDLRNSLSHGLPFSERSEVEGDVDLFVCIQNDLKKVGTVITNILLKSKIKICRNIFKCFAESTNLQDIKEACEKFFLIEAEKLISKNFQTLEHEKLKYLIKQLDDITGEKNEYEKAVFDQINYMIIAVEEKLKNNEIDYKRMISILRGLKFKNILETNIDNDKRIMKFRSKIILKNIQRNAKSLQNIAGMIEEIVDYVLPRLQSNIRNEANALVLQACDVIHFEIENIGWIEKMLEKLNKNRFTKGNSKTKQKTNKNEPEKNWNTQLKEYSVRLSTLENILNKNGLNNDLIQNYTSYKNDKKLQAVVEILIQDIMEILKSATNILADNYLFLDDNPPLLIGRSLRNYLAHCNALIDVLPSDPSISTITNAKKFISESTTIRNKTRIGKSLKDIPRNLKDKYNQDLQIIVNQEAMFMALEMGDLEAFKSSLKKGADPNAKSINLWTALHFAAKGPNLDVVKLIFSQNFTSKTVDGQSPLHIAAAHGRTAIVEFFVKEKGFKVDDTNVDNQTPLHLAAQNGYKCVVEVLLKAGAKTLIKDLAGLSPLQYATAYNHKNVLMVLLEKEKSVDANETIGGFTSLHIAAEMGYLEIVRFLIQSKAKVNAKNDANWIPLHAATANGHFEVVQDLILNGADVKAKNLTNNCTPLHYAVEYGHENIAKLLLMHDADVNAADKVYYNVPLHYAAIGGYIGIVQILLKNKANVHSTRRDGMTSLHFASHAGHKEIVELLIKNNASISAENKDGWTALHLSSLHDHKDIVELLIKEGANIHSRDGDKRTPLFWAGMRGHKDIVGLLIENRANTNSIDVDGNTVLHISCAYNCIEVVEVLIKEKGAKLDLKNKDGQTPLHLVSTDFLNAKLTKSRLYCRVAASISDRFDEEIDICLQKNETNTSVKGVNAEKIVKLLLDNGADVHATFNGNYTSLHFAAMMGHTEIVKTLIKGKANVNAQKDGYYTPLHMAVIGNQKEVIKILIENRSNVNVKDYMGRSPLLCAILYNYTEIVELLIAEGADVNADSCLSSAVFLGFQTIVKILLRNDKINIETQTNQFNLHSAAQRGFKGIVEALIAKGADIDAATVSGATSLHFAAQRGHKEIVEALIAKGADIDAAPVCGVTSLHCAAQGGHKEIVEVLLENKANLNPWSDQYGTPLQIASVLGHSGVVEVLLRYGVYINTKSSKIRTAIELAAANGHLKVLKLLLGCAGTNVNTNGDDGWSILHIASQEDQLQIIRYLVDADANIHAKTGLGLKAIHIAAAKGHKEVVEFYLNNGCHLNDVDAVVGTLLHYATHYGQLEMVKYLVEQNADINLANVNRSRPIHLAAEGDYEDIIKVLLINGAIFDDVDNFGRKPIDLAKSNSLIKLLTSVQNLFKAVKYDNLLDVKTYIEEGAFINAKNKTNVTPLHYASWKGYERIVDALLGHHANPNLIGKEGSTPLHYAAKFSHLGIVKALLSNGAKYNVLSDNFKKPSDLATNREIIELLKLIEQLFEKIHNGDPKVIDDLKQIKDTGILKPTLNACNTEGKTLMVVAICNDFPEIKMLKHILEEDDHVEIEKADTLAYQEKYQEALNIFQSIHMRRKALFGPDNPCTLDTQTNIATILYEQQRYQEALNMFKKIHEKQKAIMGQNNKDTLSSKNDIALVLHRQGKNEEALEIYKEVYEKQKEVLRAADLGTLKTQLYMALVLDSLERYEEALCMNYEICDSNKETLGAAHPLILAAQHNIASALANQKKYDEAHEIFKQVYEKKRQILGPVHSDSLRALQNMGLVRLEQGKYDEAWTNYQQVFELQKSALGSDHLDTLHTQCNIANVLFHQGKYLRALQAYKDGFNQRLAILGPDHPSILDTLSKFKIIDLTLKMEGYDSMEVMKNIQEDIFVAIKDDDIKTIQDLICEGENVDTPNADGRTPLQFAVNCGHKDIVNILLRNGADATKVANKGNTSLHIATSKNNVEIVEILLQHVKQVSYNIYGDFLNAQTTISGSTSLHIAVKNGCFEIVKCLLKHGAFYNATDKNNEVPLQYSENKTIKDFLNLTDQLFECAEKGNSRVINKLDQLKPDEFIAIVNAQNSHGQTAIDVAFSNKYKVLANMLIKMMEEKFP